MNNTEKYFGHQRNTTKNLLITCGFSCGKKSAGIPKVFAANFTIQRNFLRISGFRKFRRYFQGFSCGFFHSKQFPADFAILRNSAGIPKDLAADFGSPVSYGFYNYNKFRR
jgi:hypothetical protein